MPETEAETAEDSAEDMPLTALKGVGETTEIMLREVGGYQTAAEVLEASVEDLSDIPTIGESTAEQILEGGVAIPENEDDVVAVYEDNRIEKQGNRKRTAWGRVVAEQLELEVDTVAFGSHPEADSFMVQRDDERVLVLTDSLSGNTIKENWTSIIFNEVCYMDYFADSSQEAEEHEESGLQIVATSNELSNSCWGLTTARDNRDFLVEVGSAMANGSLQGVLEQYGHNPADF